MSTILVGNGSSVLEHKVGWKIDKFTNVCRFSWYHIDGFEEYVGTKANNWFTTTTCERRIKDPHRAIMVHSWDWSDDYKLYKALMYKNDHVFRTTRDMLEEMAEYMDIEYYPFSSGAICAWVSAVRNKHNVVIHGFDWAIGYEGKHHYGDKQVIGSVHKPEIEKEFFDKMLADGLISYLV